jgi:lysophospholipase L1-like esterase
MTKVNILSSNLPSSVVNVSSGTPASGQYASFIGVGNAVIPAAAPTNSSGSGQQVNAEKLNIVGGRAIVATRWPIYNGQGLGAAAGSTTWSQHIIDTACSDLRIGVGNPFLSEAVLNNEIWVKAGIYWPACPVTELNTTLSTSSAITSFGPIDALPIPAGLASGASFTITDLTGAHSQTWTLTSAAASGTTTLAVSSQTPNFAYPPGSVITSAQNFPVTFGGLQYGVIDQYGYALSDPCPIEFPQGAIVYPAIYQRVPFKSGSGYISLVNGSYAAGVTQIQTSLPPDGLLPCTNVTLDQGAQAETVTVLSYTGTANPYTLNLAAATTKTHATGAVIGQMGLSNAYVRGDWGDCTAYVDDSWSTSGYSPGGGLTKATSVLGAAITAGANTFKTTTLIYGTMAIVDTGGSPETVTITNIQGISNPYTYTISGTFANNHSSGAIVQGQLPYATALVPYALAADRTISTRKKTVIGSGDSIMNVTGPAIYPTESYFSLAMEALGQPYYNLSKSGEAAFQFVIPGVRPLRSRLITLGDWVEFEYGTNDIYNGQSLAQTQENVIDILNFYVNRGLKVIMETLTPRTSDTTDLWNSVGAQTQANASFNTVRIAYNNWVRNYSSNNLSNLVSGIFDAANVFEVNSSGTLTQDGGYWAAGITVQGFAGPFTADGLHPSWQGHQARAAALQAQVTANGWFT